jgi:MFS family permease
MKKLDIDYEKIPVIKYLIPELIHIFFLRICRMRIVMKKTEGLKNAFINGMLVTNAFAWYFLFFEVLRDVLSQQTSSNFEILTVFGANTVAIAVSALAALITVDRFKKRALFLRLWLFAGIFVSLVPIGLGVSNTNYLILSSILLGAYFGAGMPATMGHYSEHIKVENRGKTSGITFFAIGLVFAILGAFAIGNIIVACLILAAIKIIGFATFQFAKENDDEHGKIQKISFSSIVKYRSFILYFLPWSMFSLVNYMTGPIIDKIFYSQANNNFLLNVLGPIIIALSALVCGFLSDKLGRKHLVIMGFIMIGLGYGSLGILPLDYSRYIYVFSDGVAWGIFSVIFLLTIWGDLADVKMSDKFYFIGVLPYLFSNFGRLLFEPYLLAIDELAIFSFASVFLFIAVLPLVFAPETLPENIMKALGVNSYVGKAMEKAKKEAKNEQ